jgi:hypothetical protein
MTLALFPFLSDLGAYGMLELAIVLSALAVVVASALAFLVWRKMVKIEHNIGAISDFLGVPFEDEGGKQ